MNENIPTPVCDLRAVRMLSYSQSGVELYGGEQVDRILRGMTE